MKKTLLLHACCAPCLSAVIERLIDEYEITVFFCNPNISDKKEYFQRRDEAVRFVKEFSKYRGVNIGFIEADYDPGLFFAAAEGLENEPEGGLRCDRCFLLRFGASYKKAKELGFDFFDSTLSISPHKNYEKLCCCAKSFEEDAGPKFLAGNYKKKDGFKRSTELSAEYGLYRQDYCGCVFSKAEAEKRRDLR